MNPDSKDSLNKSKTARGIFFTLAGGTMWGFSGTCGQYLFTYKNLDSAWVTVTRMICAGIILLVLAFIKQRKEMKEIMQDKRDRRQLFIFSIFGLMFCQYSYMTAISHSNAGTATVLQYLGPVLIMIVSCFMAKKLPSGSYTMLPEKIIGRWGSTVVTGYGMLIGGIFLFFATRYWTVRVTFDLGTVLGLAAIVLIGTALSFTLYLQGVSDIGSVKASMLACIEPVSATVISALWLGTDFTVMDFAGLAAIITTVLLLTQRKRRG